LRQNQYKNNHSYHLEVDFGIKHHLVSLVVCYVGLVLSPLLVDVWLMLTGGGGGWLSIGFLCCGIDDIVEYEGGGGW